MKSHAHLTLAAILGGLAVMYFVTHIYRPERVRPGSPEFEAYIRQYTEECLKTPARYEISAALSPSELEAACVRAILQADRFDPSARPLKH